MEVKKIVLTGGPCAGKTKILEYLRKELTEAGYYVLVVPETASEYIKNNVLPNEEREHTLMFQDIIMYTQYVKEQLTEKYADFIKDKQDIIILYDRAIMDSRAYFSQSDYEDILRKYDINEMEMIDKYDLVIDLISTATLKKECYSLNDTRSEDIEKASRIDSLTSVAWLLHRNLKVIKPTDTLDEKAVMVLNYVYYLLNNCQQCEDVMVEIDKEKSSLSVYHEDNAKKIDLKRIFLDHVNGDYIDYVITRRQYNHQVSFVFDKINNGVLERSKRISAEDYLKLLDIYGVKKIENLEQIVFVDNGNYFQIVSQNDKLFLQTSEENLEYIPENIVLKNKDIKKVIRKKNMI